MVTALTVDSMFVRACDRELACVGSYRALQQAAGRAPAARTLPHERCQRQTEEPFAENVSFYARRAATLLSQSNDNNVTVPSEYSHIATVKLGGRDQRKSAKLDLLNYFICPFSHKYLGVNRYLGR